VHRTPGAAGAPRCLWRALPQLCQVSDAARARDASAGARGAKHLNNTEHVFPRSRKELQRVLARQVRVFEWRRGGGSYAQSGAISSRAAPEHRRSAVVHSFLPISQRERLFTGTVKGEGQSRRSGATGLVDNTGTRAVRAGRVLHLPRRPGDLFICSDRDRSESGHVTALASRAAQFKPAKIASTYFRSVTQSRKHL
jgi:hypothetical protein